MFHQDSSACVLFLLCAFHYLLPVFSQQLVFCLENDEKTAFLSTEDYAVADTGVAVTEFGYSYHDCLSDCALSKTCASFEYSKNGTCRLNTNSVEKGFQLVPTPGVTYSHKICLPAKSTFCGTSFTLEPQKILIGNAQAVFVAPTVSSCLAKCLETREPEAEFNCSSFQYYHRDHQCVLNSATKNNYPDLFTPENVSEDEVDYVENNCYAAWSSWAPWSPCRGPGDGRRIRFRQCKTLGACKDGSSIEMETCTSTSIQTTTPEVSVVIIPSTDRSIVDPPPPLPSTSPDPPATDQRPLSLFIASPDPTVTDIPPFEMAVTTQSNPITNPGCTSTYCGGKEANPCQEYGKLGYASYTDCLRGQN